MSDERRITINLLPQDPACWLFIAIAVVMAGIAWAHAFETARAAEAHAREVEATHQAK